jgi:hypothetical protein
VLGRRYKLVFLLCIFIVCIKLEKSSLVFMVLCNCMASMQVL